MADNDKQVFDRAEAELRALGSRLQITTQELITLYLLMIAKDLAVPLPAAFDGLTTNYATFLNPSGGDINDEKLAMFTYLARVNTDMPTLQYVLCNKIAQARAIASVQPIIPVPIPAAPYIPPAPKKPNPPPVGGLLVTLSSSVATTTTGTAVTLTATVLVPPGRAVSKVEFYEGVTLLGEDTSSPYTFSYTPSTVGAKSLTARAYDNSPSPVVSVSNVVSLAVSNPAAPVPTIAVSAPSTANTGSAVTLSATASITGDTIASVQFRVNGVNQGAADTTSPYSISWTPATPGTYTITAVATGTQGGTATSPSASVSVTNSAVPTPSVEIAATTRRAGLINEAVAVNATTSITGDTIASVQFRVDGTNLGAVDTSSPYSVNYTPTTIGIKQLSAIATGSQGGSTTSANYSFQAFNTQLLGGAVGAGCSLGSSNTNFILFDDNEAVGGIARSMAILVGGVLVATFNYTGDAYEGRSFAFFNNANSTMYTDTIKSSVSF